MQLLEQRCCDQLTVMNIILVLWGHLGFSPLPYSSSRMMLSFSLVTHPMDEGRCDLFKMSHPCNLKIQVAGYVNNLTTSESENVLPEPVQRAA